jgi:hypothetical protein
VASSIACSSRAGRSRERGCDDGAISIATAVALGTIWRMLHVRVAAAESVQFVQNLEKRPQDENTHRATAVPPLLSKLQRMTSVSATIARLMSAKSMASSPCSQRSRSPACCDRCWCACGCRADTTKPSGSATYQNQETQKSKIQIPVFPGWGKVTSQSALRADDVEISALAINICCYHIGSLEKEHEQACHDRNHHESEHL